MKIWIVTFHLKILLRKRYIFFSYLKTWIRTLPEKDALDIVHTIIRYKPNNIYDNTKESHMYICDTPIDEMITFLNMTYEQIMNRIEDVEFSTKEYIQELCLKKRRSGKKFEIKFICKNIERSIRMKKIM